MRHLRHTAAGVVAGLCLLFAPAPPSGARARQVDRRKTPLMKHATGTFEVKVIPQAAEEGVGDPTVGRMALDKKFSGDLEGVSRGQMLTAMTGTEGSAAYVAVERVRGRLAGREGTFALYHSGVMSRGAQQLAINVVPDSGTEGLTGIAGAMKINVAGGKHTYDFEYTLPE